MEDPPLGSLWWQPFLGPIWHVLVLVELLLLVGAVRKVSLDSLVHLVLDVEDVAEFDRLVSSTRRLLLWPWP